ncbi:hypothetical protein TNCT_19281 [Trichonephila clavata]|uniref:Uncharacterized protein n=1 Tax=Trichonephila clavata TaxID=2740835 RepID=A0A8X6JMJ8_TRICU|nr:hypothetical protein TNCT_19281 [Trichonephila clavata]
MLLQRSIYRVGCQQLVFCFFSAVDRPASNISSRPPFTLDSAFPCKRFLACSRRTRFLQQDDLSANGKGAPYLFVA